MPKPQKPKLFKQKMFMCFFGPLGRAYDLLKNVELPLSKLNEMLLDLRQNGVSEQEAVCRCIL